MAADRLAGLPALTFLDSAMRHAHLGRYSFIAADPFGSFRVDRQGTFWNEERYEGEPLSFLRSLLERYRQEAEPELPPFTGGAAGFIAYEFAHHLERLPPTTDNGQPDLLLHFYDVVLAFDHHRGRAWLISSGWPEDDGDRRLLRAEARASWFLDRLAKGQTAQAVKPIKLEWAPAVDRSTVEASIGRVIEYVLAGDIFQANLSHHFEARLPETPRRWLDVYLNLRRANPATFGAWLDYGDLKIASCSPERFIRLEGDAVETRPIKGTARRSVDPLEDDQLVAALTGSEKERAENVMIVDLLRNDLSRVCLPHSVQVPSLCAVESYAGLHHLVSTVTGRLRPGLDALDLLAASFPGGSITGAPKLRAMEVIAELEKRPRGIYCGCIGYIGFDGRMDTNVAIRTLTLANGVASFDVGGGITVLSDPAREYEETMVKAARLFAAFSEQIEPRL
ncbi:aminodeoxychorismate synthase component I [Arboricoccus pini]|uniref:aminodeoxychorismate synthase component I n=1 Tax=Arboricoccus pini TaxID=1963835 RepID=UPI0013FD73D0|nr:aminodeoxychorismate synthase component I [Arboricoccus pini]